MEEEAKTVNAFLKEDDDLGSYEKAIALGVDISMISICKKIRHLALLDRIKLDMEKHRSGLNRHLFDYIEYCGYKPLDFIKSYLAQLQPFMIERRKDQEPDKSFVCVIDNLYRISIYIKFITKQFEEIIVSFHEDNKRGIAKTNSLIQRFDNSFVPVFADSVTGKVSGENKYTVKCFFQRGMLVLPLELPAIKCKEVFLVRRNTIETHFISLCNDYIRDLYTSDLQLDFDKVEVFSMLQQISFTSYGNTTFSSISLLIDSICVQKDSISRNVADFALVTFVRNLTLTIEQREDLMRLLEQKFTVTSIRGIDLILDRVRSNLYLISD